MSKYQFDVDAVDNRVSLHSDFVKRAVFTTSRSHTTRRKYTRWDTDEVIKACELYSSGWKPTEIAEAMNRPYITVSNKLNAVFGRRTGAYKYSSTPCVMHEENRVRSIMGESLMDWNEAIKKVQ